jgi:hypothetical protein
LRDTGQRARLFRMRGETVLYAGPGIRRRVSLLALLAVLVSQAGTGRLLLAREAGPPQRDVVVRAADPAAEIAPEIDVVPSGASPCDTSLSPIGGLPTPGSVRIPRIVPEDPRGRLASERIPHPPRASV